MNTENSIIANVAAEIEKRLDSSKTKHNVEKEMSKHSYINNLSEERKEIERNNYIILSYLNTIRKDPPSRPRKIHYSNELRDKICNFSDELKSNLEHIKNQLETGQKITYHLSTGIFDGCRQDVILNAWNITHIHISSVEATSKSGMRKNRSGFLLLCIIKENDVYFIDVINHPTKASDFACIDFLRIIYNNSWMELIGYEELKGVVEISPKTNEIKNEETLYSIISQWNTGFEFDNHFFHPLFSGVVSTGHKFTDVCTSKDFYNNINELHEISKDYIYHAPIDMSSLGKITGHFNDGKEYECIIHNDLRIELV